MNNANSACSSEKKGRIVLIIICALTLGSACKNGGIDPVILSVSPQTGRTGEEITISGEYFGDEKADGSILFSDTAATTVVSWSDTEIVAIVPEEAVSGPVSVVVGTTASNTIDFAIEAGPALNSILPESASVGDTLTLTGVGFGSERGANRVLFGQTEAAAYLLWSNTIIVLTVPAVAGSVSVAIEVDGFASNALTFSVAAPTDGNEDSVYELLNAYPSSGVAGDTVILVGKLFGDTRGQSKVCFGEASAGEYVLWSDNTIIAVVPDNAQSDEVHIRVNSVDSNQLAFDVLPAINSILPDHAHYDDVISIIGTGFGDSQKTLFIGDTATGTYYTWTNKVIVCRLSDMASVGSNDVYVKLDDAASDPVALNVLWDTFTTMDGLSSNNTYGVLIGEDDLWVSTWGGGINRSHDDGQTWLAYNTGAGLPSNYIRQVELNNTDIWAGTYAGMCKSADDGHSWTTYTTADGLGNNYILSLAVDQSAGLVWAGTNNGGISKTEDDGATWTTYTTAAGLAGNYVYDIYVESDSTVWVATNAGVSRSEDFGGTWTNFTATQGLSSNTCRAVHADGSTIWVGTANQLNRSDNGGLTWSWYSSLDGLGGNDCLALYADGNTVWVATNGFGLSVTRDGGGTWRNFTTDDGLASNTVRAVATRLQEISVASGSGVSKAVQ